MLQEVLDLDRDVVAHARVRFVQPFDDPHRVRRTVEEVGIAECDVPRATGDLGGDVGGDDVRLHDAKLSGVDREQSDSAGTGAGIRGWLRCSRPAGARHRASAASRISRAAEGLSDRGRGNESAANRRPEETAETAEAAENIWLCVLGGLCGSSDSYRPRRPGPPRTRRRRSRRRRGRAATRRSAARTDRTRRCGAAGFARRAAAISGPASRVAVCIGR